MVLANLRGGPSFRVEIIIEPTPAKLILCTYVVKEIKLHMKITHLRSNGWFELAFNAKKFVASNG